MTVTSDTPILVGRRIDPFIRRCLARIHPTDAERIRRKLSKLPLDSPQQHHTLHELVAGAFLSSVGHSVRNEVNQVGKTPDWTILTGDGRLSALVEVVTFHTDQRTSAHILSQLSGGRSAGYFPPDSYSRLYSSLGDKAAKYKTIASSTDVPFVIAVFLSFEVTLSAEELTRCLFEETEPLFTLYKDLSGVFVIDEHAGTYSFRFQGNPFALRPCTLPSGEFSG